MIFYDYDTPTFFDTSFHENIPDNAIEVSENQRLIILGMLSRGLIVTRGDDGEPIGVARKAPTVAELLDMAKANIRLIREPMLSAVTGIGWDASEAGNDALVQEARNIRNALREITDDPSLNAAQTYEEMRAAGVAAYRRIAAGASPAFAATFKEFTGA